MQFLKHTPAHQQPAQRLERESHVVSNKARRRPQSGASLLFRQHAVHPHTSRRREKQRFLRRKP